MYIYIYAYMYVYVHICIYMYIYAHIYATERERERDRQWKEKELREAAFCFNVFFGRSETKQWWSSKTRKAKGMHNKLSQHSRGMAQQAKKHH